MEATVAKEEQRIGEQLAALEQEVSSKRNLVHKLQADMQDWEQRRRRTQAQAQAILQQAREEARDCLEQARKREAQARAEQARISEALDLLEKGSAAELKIIQERDQLRRQCETWKSQVQELAMHLELQDEEQLRSIVLLEQHERWQKEVLQLLDEVGHALEGLADSALKERCSQLVKQSVQPRNG